MEKAGGLTLVLGTVGVRLDLDEESGESLIQSGNCGVGRSVWTCCIHSCKDCFF